MAVISIKNLAKTYPQPFPRVRKFLGIKAKQEVEALVEVNLEIAEGEVFGLIGRNGAGKTTLTKIVATLVQPTSGTVSVYGNDTVEDDVKVRSLVGLATAEERSFYWRLTCRQNMMFFSRLHGLTDKAAKTRISDLFEQLGLTELRDRRFSDLSTGNKQKLAVARALLAHPQVLLLDEPTRSLDPLAAANMRDIIASLENVTILLTSHNLSEIEELCGRVAIITKGAIGAVDTPTGLRAQHTETQTVKIELDGATEESLIKLNNLIDFEMERNGDSISIIFKRDHHDALLGKTISELSGHGARIVNIETETATLLDVLEQYE